MKKITQLWRRAQHSAYGQGLVEFALVLPFLILLVLGIMEVGFAFYDYITLATANREGIRLASRARFTDDMVAGLVVSSSGLVERPDGTFEPNMKLLGEGANLGTIITHVSISPEGNLLSVSTYVSGTIISPNNEPRLITPEDTRLTEDVLTELIQNSLNATSQINTYRESLSYDTINNELVILETFLGHPLLTPIIGNKNSTITLYFQSAMRVMHDSRDTVQ
ncbi:MAG: TadE family protein [Anaerolineae bacterium]